MFSMKKILAIAGAGAMLVSVAACGSGTAGDDGGKKEISFQTWNLKNDKYTPYFEALIKAYEKDHPDVTVKWLDAPSDGYEDKLSSQAAAGELPDIVDGGNSILYGLAKAGALLDVSKQAPDAEKDYYEGAWKSVTMQGNGVEKGAYGLPWYVNDGPTYWNTELMQKCGLDPNKIPTTWDEYFAAGDTIVQNCKDVYLGTTMGYNAEDLMTAGVKSFMSEDHSKYTFNDEAGVKQISRFVELYKKGGIPPEALDSSWSRPPISSSAATWSPWLAPPTPLTASSRTLRTSTRTSQSARVSVTTASPLPWPTRCSASAPTRSTPTSPSTSPDS